MSEKNIIHRESRYNTYLDPYNQELDDFLTDVEEARNRLVREHGDGVIRVGDGTGFLIEIVVVTSREETDAEYRRRCERAEKIRARKRASEEAAERNERLTLKRLAKKYGVAIGSTGKESEK